MDRGAWRATVQGPRELGTAEVTSMHAQRFRVLLVSGMLYFEM